MPIGAIKKVKRIEDSFVVRASRNVVITQYIHPSISSIEKSQQHKHNIMYLIGAAKRYHCDVTNEGAHLRQLSSSRRSLFVASR